MIKASDIERGVEEIIQSTFNINKSVSGDSMLKEHLGIGTLETDVLISRLEDFFGHWCVAIHRDDYKNWQSVNNVVSAVCSILIEDGYIVVDDSDINTI